MVSNELVAPDSIDEVSLMSIRDEFQTNELVRLCLVLSNHVFSVVVITFSTTGKILRQNMIFRIILSILMVLF